MAWNTPLADPSGFSLDTFVVSGLTCSAIVAALPAGIAIRTHLHRTARHVRRQIRAAEQHRPGGGRNTTASRYIDADTDTVVTARQVTDPDTDPAVPVGTWLVQMDVPGGTCEFRVPPARFVRQYRPLADEAAPA
jgi:hypothetical protein